MGQCIAVVSGKGGTGKTSFTAGVGEALALSGRRVLCMDCDVGLRNLDLALGLSDRALMDFSDVAQGRCSLESAVVEHPRLPGLFLLTAPVRTRGRPVTETQMADLLAEVRKRYDFCLLDAPAGLGTGFLLATAAADRAVVVTTTDPSSLRDAQHTVMELDRFGSGKLHLVVNRVRKKLLRSMHATIDDAIDKAGLPLIGVVPEDDTLLISLNRGTPLLLANSQSPAALAYRNIAARLQGGRVPLLRIK
ncbi:septum site-determining protein MinD [Oscillibacter valericigenes]|uniref:septum site-determining protein MinD n=1 Tax=Oscillibacter valericigenes TaxID=351091 RepID=UPI001F42F75F|nr:septum site-determining protein MinD [Oscillibacter valericigenes]MCF2663700.1 septum site-determining protein MinD [Oscillibacter valericigenes]